MDKIIKTMEMKPFDEIMSRYEKKIEEHEKLIESMNMACDFTNRLLINKENIEI